MGGNRYKMKTKTFQMRMSEKTKKQLEFLKNHLNLSASAVIDMLISEKAKEYLQDMEVNANGD